MDNNRVPSFKETLSLITSLRNFASQIHNYFMNEVSVDEYVKFILREKYDSGEIKKIYTNWGRGTFLGYCHCYSYWFIRKRHE